jgi:hypothetical protein
MTPKIEIIIITAKRIVVYVSFVAKGFAAHFEKAESTEF